MRRLLLPITIVFIGFGWLLSATGMIPQVNWLWPSLLAIGGIFVILADRINPYNLTLGLFFIYCSLMAVLRQAGVISVGVEIPLIIIGFGLIWIASVLLLKSNDL